MDKRERPKSDDSVDPYPDEAEVPLGLRGT
jgi:hypothetical protein